LALGANAAAAVEIRLAAVLDVVGAAGRDALVPEASATCAVRRRDTRFAVGAPRTSAAAVCVHLAAILDSVAAARGCAGAVGAHGARAILGVGTRPARCTWAARATTIDVRLSLIFASVVARSGHADPAQATAARAVFGHAAGFARCASTACSTAVHVRFGSIPQSVGASRRISATRRASRRGGLWCRGIRRCAASAVRQGDRDAKRSNDAGQRGSERAHPLMVRACCPSSSAAFGAPGMHPPV
jgi:hypothetical protein